MTIRRRLTLWYGVAMAITIGLVAAIVWFRFAGDLRASLDEALAVQVADAKAVIGTPDGRGRAGDALTEDPARPGIFTVVEDRTGKVLLASRSAPSGLPVVAAGQSTWRAPGATSDTLLYAEVTADKRVIVAGSSLAHIDAELAQLAGQLLAVGTLAATASLAGGWFLARRAMAPVARMMDEADRIHDAEHLLGQRLHGPGARDEIGRLAATLNQMLDRVEDAVHRQRAFVASASHDLRTPIAALRTELELALRPDATSDELRAAVGEALGDVRRLGSLADDLLGLAAAEQGGRSPDHVAVALPALVETAASRAAAAGTDRSIGIEIEAEATAIVTDRVRIEQAIANLVDNAVRHSPVGGAVTIRARCTAAPAVDRAGQPMLDVDVLDRGPGVPPTSIGLLFVPFARSRARDGGVGLGLATAEAAVRALGGRIGYRDRPGGGAWFWFRVPVGEAA